jgi:hypothetical protein
VAAIAQYFSRFHFNSLRFEFKSKLPTTTSGTYVTGIVDDDNSSTSTSPAQVLDYRVSMEKHLYMDTILRWSPIDKSKWYYTTPEIGQMGTPCTVFLTSDDALPASTSLFAFDLHYSITFEGATNSLVRVESSDRDFVSLPPTPSGHVLSPLPKSTLRR